MSSRRRMAVLATVCLAVFAINLDTTIVNVALPSLTRQLGASTSTLQWVVDGYSLAFAALVLTGGSIGDRFGRRPVLIVGLLGFALASAAGGLSHSASALIGIRFVMGAFAALIYPTTLSIITNAYTDRKERAGAIGIWGAVTGLGVAVGPVTGGLLLAHFWYGSVFLALVPAAAIAAVAAAFIVPESRESGGARLDLPGLLASSAAIALLVYTIIEAPGRGWGSGVTIARICWHVGYWRVVCDHRTAHCQADARRHAVQGARILRRQRCRDGGVLRSVRIHFPHHAVLSIHPSLRDALHWRTDSACCNEHRRRLRSGCALCEPTRHSIHRRVRPHALRAGLCLDRRLSHDGSLLPDCCPDGHHGIRARSHEHSSNRVNPQCSSRCQSRGRFSGERRHKGDGWRTWRRRYRQCLQHCFPPSSPCLTGSQSAGLRIREGPDLRRSRSRSGQSRPRLTRFGTGCHDLVYEWLAHCLYRRRGDLLGRCRCSPTPPGPTGAARRR